MVPSPSPSVHASARDPANSSARDSAAKGPVGYSRNAKMVANDDYDEFWNVLECSRIFLFPTFGFVGRTSRVTAREIGRLCGCVRAPPEAAAAATCSSVSAFLGNDAGSA